MIEFLRAAEVADRVGVSRATIIQRVKHGTIVEPDAVIRGKDAGRRGDGTIYLWLPETIDVWWATATVRKRPSTWREADRAAHATTNEQGPST